MRKCRWLMGVQVQGGHVCRSRVNRVHDVHRCDTDTVGSSNKKDLFSFVKKILFNLFFCYK